MVFLIASTSVVGTGRGILTHVPTESSNKWVNLKKGATQVFFVSSTTGDVQHAARDESAGTIYGQNHDLKLMILIAYSKYSFGECHE